MRRRRMMPCERAVPMLLLHMIICCRRCLSSMREANKRCTQGKGDGGRRNTGSENKKISINLCYSLIILNVPWAENDLPYSPLIIENSSKRIVGAMLPFNEI